MRWVHLHRPWAPLSWCDLVISTPQYALPPRPNVIANLLPFQPAISSKLAWQDDAASLPRPWTVVLVGGSSRPFRFDREAALRLADLINARVRTASGSAWVLASPRTPADVLNELERAIKVPARIVPWRPDSPYPALRDSADDFIVTADSASMSAEALTTGKPVVSFLPSLRPDWRWRMAFAWRRASERDPHSLISRAFEIAVATGVLTSVRDMRLMHEAHARAGLTVVPTRAREVSGTERRNTIARIRLLIDA